MQKNFLRILDLGEHDFWKILHDVSNINLDTPEGQKSYIDLQQSLSSVSTHYWKGSKTNPETDPEASTFNALLESLGLAMTTHNCASLDAEALQEMAAAHTTPTLNIACGFTEGQLDILTANAAGCWFNGYSPINAPWAAMAEVALIQNITENIDSFRVCVMGAVAGFSQSLMEAAIYVPFELFMAVPPWGDPDHYQTGLALKSGAKIFMTREPRLAIDGAHLIYIDTRLPQMAQKASKKEKPQGPINIDAELNHYVWQNGFTFNEEYKQYAKPDVQVLTLLDNSENSLLPDVNIKLSTKRSNLRKITLMQSLVHMAKGLEV